MIIFTIQFVNEIGYLYFIWISLAYFLYGAHYALFPTITVKLFGPVLGAKVYPFIFAGFAISTLIGVCLAKIIIPIF